jgi:hypothetical protein
MIRTIVASAVLATAATLGLAGTASAQPVFAGGLVNINVTDVIDDTQVLVQVPIGVAANVCGVRVAILAELGPEDTFDCEAGTVQELPVAFQP